MATTVEQRATGPRSAEEERLLALRKRETRQRWFWRIAGMCSSWRHGSSCRGSSGRTCYPGRSASSSHPSIDRERTLLLQLRRTLTRIAIGFGLAFLVGIVIGILTQSPWWNGFFRDAVTISLVSPSLIWALTGLVIWGFEPQGWIFAIVMTSFALVTVNVAEGIRALPKDLMDMSRAFGVTNWRRQREIVFPFLAPFVFTALRFGFSVGWKVTVLTEVFSSNEGIGFEMRVAQQLFRMDEFFAWAISFFIFALILEKVVLQRSERRFFRWRQEVAS